MFLYNHGTKNDLHTFEVFQRTRIEEEDEGGSCKSVITGPFTEQFADLSQDKREAGELAWKLTEEVEVLTQRKLLSIGSISNWVPSGRGCCFSPESSCEFQTLSEVCGN